MLSIRLVIFLTSLGLVATLRAASPTPPESPPITPVSARKHSLKDAVPLEAPGDSIVARHTGFEVVPGKDPNGWAFIIEPYLWGLGVDGTVGVKRFDTHVDYNPVTVVKHLDWGIMAKGEVRKGKWGILGDGFFAQLSASGDPPGPLYNNANIKLQQGMVELALAYRIIDDRRAFLDIYAGARYNYFGINVDASIDDAGVQEMSECRSACELSLARSAKRLRRGRCGKSGHRAIAHEEAILKDDVSVLARCSTAADLESDSEKRLRQDLCRAIVSARGASRRGYSRVNKGVAANSALFNARELVANAADRLRKIAAASLTHERTRSKASARVAQAEQKLSKALAKQLENLSRHRNPATSGGSIPSSASATQINFTRWLFLALQGDVGGFGAGSQIAWFASGSIGFNLTRNIFLETGYRYFYMDYAKNGLVYDAAQSGLFTGVGVKF